ncbi:bifunctional heptose 7-phosphate kinase/heptose 1-phosphate adenyltransferase, partial [bacterium M00.F.Ca.ET.168.01.1.1]
VIGADKAGDDLLRMLGDLGADTDGLVQRQDRMTSSKSRFSALNQQVLRFDEEEIKPLASAERAKLIDHFQATLGRADIVILSDYGKGILLDGVAGELIAICRDAGKPVLVDPKGRDYA